MKSFFLQSPNYATLIKKHVDLDTPWILCEMWWISMIHLSKEASLCPLCTYSRKISPSYCLLVRFSLLYAFVFVNMCNAVMFLCFVHPNWEKNHNCDNSGWSKNLAIALNENLYLSELTLDIQSMPIMCSLYVYFLSWGVNSCLECLIQHNAWHPVTPNSPRGPRRKKVPAKLRVSFTLDLFSIFTCGTEAQSYRYCNPRFLTVSGSDQLKPI